MVGNLMVTFDKNSYLELLWPTFCGHRRLHVASDGLRKLPDTIKATFQSCLGDL